MAWQYVLLGYALHLNHHLLLVEMSITKGISRPKKRSDLVYLLCLGKNIYYAPSENLIMLNTKSC